MVMWGSWEDVPFANLKTDQWFPSELSTCLQDLYFSWYSFYKTGLYDLEIACLSGWMYEPSYTVLSHWSATTLCCDFYFWMVKDFAWWGGGRRLVGVVLWHLQALLACTESYRFNWNGHNLKLSTTENGFLSTWIQMTCEPVMVFLLSKCNHLLFLVISEEKNFKSTSQTFHNTGKMLES